LLYLAFLKWCVENVWGDNLLAFLYSGYKGCAPKQAFALTVEVAMDDDRISGTVLRFLHSEDAYHEVDPPQCPPVYLNMIEASRGLTSCVDCFDCDLVEDNVCLYVPKVYWDLITELQVQCYPGAKKDSATCGETCSGPVPSYRGGFSVDVASMSNNGTTSGSTRQTIFNNGHTKINFRRKRPSKYSETEDLVIREPEYDVKNADDVSSSRAPSTVVFLKR